MSHMFHQHHANHLPGLFGYQSRWSVKDRIKAQAKRLSIDKKVGINDNQDHFRYGANYDPDHICVQG